MHNAASYAFTSKGKRNVSAMCSRVVKAKVDNYVFGLDQSRSRKQTKHQDDKEKKLKSLPQVNIYQLSVAYQGAATYNWRKKGNWTSKIFIDGTKNREPLNLPMCNGVWSAQLDFEPFQNVEGGHMDKCFTLVPRNFILDTHKNIRNFSVFCHKFSEAICVSPCIPIGKRHPVEREIAFEDLNYTYVFFGKVSHKGGKGGIHDKFLSPKVSKNVRDWIARYLGKMEHCGFSFMDTNCLS